MKTDDLIKAISTDAGRPAPSMAGAWGLALVAAALVALVVFTAMLGPRPDIAEAVATLRFPFKFVVTLALAGSALAVLQAVARPGADWRRTAPWLALAPALLLCAVALELLAVPAGEWRARLVGVNSMVCLAAIPLIGLGPLAIFLAALRHGAPTRPRLAGAVAGLLAGGVAATFYAAHCTDDSPLFVATWYTVAVAILAALGALLAPRVARW